MTEEMMYAPLDKDRFGLIDGDILLYACGFIADRDSLNKAAALELFDDMLINIRHTLELAGGKIFLSDSADNNFRYKVAKTYPYKGTRKDRDKPKHYQAIKDHILKRWTSEITKGMEADDGMGKAQTKQTIICSIDKDMDMIVGWHYNWKRYTIYYVSRWEAQLAFWTQMITGDSVDNIKGIYGLGPAKAAKLFKDKEHEMELYSEVVKQYCAYFGDKARKRYNENYDLICIKGAPVKFRDEPAPSKQKKLLTSGWG